MDSLLKTFVVSMNNRSARVGFFLLGSFDFSQLDCRLSRKSTSNIYLLFAL
jgi:hypothetical protein